MSHVFIYLSSARKQSGLGDMWNYRKYEEKGLDKTMHKEL